MPVHHRKAFAEGMDACESTIFENGCAPLGFQEGQTQEHDHARTEHERVSDELTGQHIRRIGDYGPDWEARRPLQQEIDSACGIRTAPVDEIGSINLMAGTPQDSDDAAGATGWLPDAFRQAFDSQ